MSKNSKPETRNQKLPFVFVNFAMTADGKTAFANRKFIPFTSERDREHMLELRATADAVMSGARTVDSGEVTLWPGGKKYRKLRLKRGLAEFNLRIIVTGSGTIDPDAAIFRKDLDVPLTRPSDTLSPSDGERDGVRGTKSPIIILTTERASASSRRRLRALADEVKICGKNEIDFRSALRWLREKWKVKRLLCEGGGELHNALIRADLVDELHLTVSPKIFGGRSAPTIADGVGFAKLGGAAQFKLKSWKRTGNEMFLVYAVVGNR